MKIFLILVLIISVITSIYSKDSKVKKWSGIVTAISGAILLLFYFTYLLLIGIIAAVIAYFYFKK